MNYKKLQNEKYHISTGAKMVPFAGYNMPIWYTSIADEHNCVRNNVGIFDVSHMGQFIVSGIKSIKFLQKVTSNNIEKLKVGNAQYSSLTNENGGIIDDLIVYCLDINKYMLVVNASNMKKDLDWLEKHNSYKVKIENISSNISLLAVQGPKASSLLNTMSNTDLSTIKFYNFIVDKISNVKNIIISATGYTGAGGFELYVSNKDATKLWNKIIQIGKKYDLQPIGLGARDTLRLEMGYCLHGSDINDQINPIEAGLDWICKKNIDYIGKNAIDSDRENNPSKKLIGFTLTEKGIPRSGYKIFNSKENEIGTVTSGSISPSTGKAIGLGFIKFSEIDYKKSIFIEIRNKKIEGKLSKTPFI